MNWEGIAGGWARFTRRASQRWHGPTEGELERAASREASRKQLAEWAAGRHVIDPIHK